MKDIIGLAGGIGVIIRYMHVGLLPSSSKAQTAIRFAAIVAKELGQHRLRLEIFDHLATFSTRKHIILRHNMCFIWRREIQLLTEQPDGALKDSA